MKWKIFLAVCVLLVLNEQCHSNRDQEDFNLGLEKISPIQKLPDKWMQWGSRDYLISTDTITRHSGKNSILIQPPEKKTTDSFGCAAYSIPAHYKCKEIELRAYMKLENVKDGVIGLMLRIDGTSGTLQFDNMMQMKIAGTSDWKQYSVVLPYPLNATIIHIGAILSGNGKLWVDDFEVLLDGVSIEKTKHAEPKQFKANLDTEFNNGSKIDTINPTSKNITDLNSLGLIWGFLKYYHPAVAEGNINWDFELFRIIPKVISSKSTSERDAILTGWIENLGHIKQGKETRINPEKIKIEPDLDWIENSGFSGDLVSALNTVRNAIRQDFNYYVGKVPGAGNPDFSTEKPYPSMKFNDTGYRLLALFRYWNMIQYYFPYKNLIGEDWKDILREFIPRMLSADNETDYTLTILELIASIHDTHANIWGGNKIIDKFIGIHYPAVEIGFIENKAVVTGFYDEVKGKESGLKKGDVITRADKRRVEDIVNVRLKYTPASNYTTQLRDIAPTLLRTNDTVVRVEFERAGIVQNRLLKTYPSGQVNIYKRYQSSDTSFKLIERDIAYINNGSVKRAHLPEIWEAMKETKGLIIDIRNYPSEFPIYELSNYLLPARTPFVKFTTGSIITPGLFTFGDSLVHAGHDNKDYYKGKVFILVNEVTISSAEFHAMAYRTAPNAIVIGSTTAGADGNVSEIYLPGGIRTLISGIGVYYPDGRETQRAGIVPDVEVKPTIAGIKAGRDEVLEKAIEIINKN